MVQHRAGRENAARLAMAMETAYHQGGRSANAGPAREGDPSMAQGNTSAPVDTPNRPGWVLAIIAMMGLVAAGTVFVLRQYQAAAPRTLIKPAYAPGALPSPGPVTRTNARERFLAFLPEGAYYTMGRALRQADGYPPGASFPADIAVRRDGATRWWVTVHVPVNVAYLTRVGEIAVGSVPGASDIRTGQLAVSTNESIYGVSMNPKTHVAVYRFLLAKNGRSVWALNWNGLGIISQSDSLQ